MTRRAATIVVALVVAALIGVGLLAIPGSPFEQRPTLGLDLQGGLEVTLQAVPPRDRKLTKADLDRSVSIMRDRVDKLGVSEPEIRTQGDDQISIQLPGVKDPAAAAAIIGKTAQLELFDLQANLVAPSIDVRTRQPIPTPKLYDLLAGQQSLAAKGEPDTYYVFQTKGKKLVRGPVNSKESALAKWDGKLPPGHKLFAVPPDTVVVSCGIGEESCPGVGQLNPTSNSWYLFRYTPPEVPEMTGEDLDLGGTRQDFDTRTGEPIVLMDFTNKGADKFEDITREMRSAGSSSSTPSAAARATTRTGCRASRSCSTARSSRIRRSTSSSTRAASPARTARRSPASETSATRRTSRWCSRPARSRSSSAPSTRPPSRPRSGRTRSRRPRRLRSSACSRSRSSC